MEILDQMLKSFTYENPKTLGFMHRMCEENRLHWRCLADDQTTEISVKVGGAIHIYSPPEVTVAVVVKADPTNMQIMGVVTDQAMMLIERCVLTADKLDESPNVYVSSRDSGKFRNEKDDEWIMYSKVSVLVV